MYARRWGVDCQCKTVQHWLPPACSYVSVITVSVPPSANAALKHSKSLLAVLIIVRLKHQPWAILNTWKVLHGKIVYLTSVTRLLKMPTPLCLYLHLYPIISANGDCYSHCQTVFTSTGMICSDSDSASLSTKFYNNESVFKSGKHSEISKRQYWHTSANIIKDIHPSPPTTTTHTYTHLRTLSCRYC